MRNHFSISWASWLLWSGHDQIKWSPYWTLCRIIMLVPRWFLLPSKLHISKISNMPYDRLCLRSLYPPLLLLYITCQVRYMCMNLSKIYSYRKNIFLRKINTPMGNLKFSIEKQGLPIKIKISRGLRKSDVISLFLIRNLPVWIKFL